MLLFCLRHRINPGSGITLTDCAFTFHVALDEHDVAVELLIRCI
jgi:hypothetical protein